MAIANILEKCPTERVEIIMENDIKKLPVIAMRGLVMFPKMVLQFDVGRDKSIKALKKAMSEDRRLFLVAQKDIEVSEPGIEDLYQVGVIAKIKQIITTDEGSKRVVVEGEVRGKMLNLIEDEYLIAEYQEYPLQEIDSESDEATAHVRVIQELFEEYCMLSPRMPKELVFKIITNDDPVFNSEFLAENLPLKVESKQNILEESNVTKRLELLAEILTDENNILKFENDIYSKVKDQVDKNQKDYYLREQLKVIHDELGEEDTDEEIGEYYKKIKALPIEAEYKEKLEKDVKKLTRMSSASADASVMVNYLDYVLDLPWTNFTKDNDDIHSASSQLNKDHFGMEKVKERILENIAVKIINPETKGQVICLAGPPGVGKTSIAKSIAKSLNRKFARMSLGGIRDEAEIRGHRKTYIGAMPGRVINAIKLAGSSNPVILLDEIDKIGSDFKGDPSSALLEVLDSEQNNTFTDHYLEIPFDLSKVIFIATANNVGAIPSPLLDRMELIEVDSYTREEKLNIAKKHLVPKVLKRYGVNKSQISIPQSTLYAVIDDYTREAGVRVLERTLGSIVRKSIKTIVSDNAQKVSVKSSDLETLLGPAKFKRDEKDKTDHIGVVNGLAWTSVGGEMLKAEVAVVDGTGKLQLTGSLGDVMKESASIAITYIRGCCEKYHIEKDFYKNKDIHIHFPEGAVPKDGPSAGVTITTAVVSALSKTPVRHDVAMTGEITLTGRVLPIGGLKEKTMAAYRSGIKTIIIPKENESDLFYVDDKVKENVKFVLADNVQTVLDNALCKRASHIKKTSSRISKTEISDTIPQTEINAQHITPVLANAK